MEGSEIAHPMLFSGRDREHRSHAIHIVRDVVEVAAILAAGFWAFYVFIYENRIKPSFTDPQPTLVATLQRTSQRSGAVGVLLKTEVRNDGAVTFYLVGYGVTVVGTRLALSGHPMPPSRSGIAETTRTFFDLSNPVPVYGFGYLTSLGNAASARGLELQPGASSFVEEHTFFVPAGRFDLLTAYVEGCFTKYNRPLPAQLTYRHNGVAVVTCKGGWHASYDAGSLDLRD